MNVEPPPANDLTASGVAVVTGGAQGIGAATADALLERGARVCVADLDGDRAGARFAAYSDHRVLVIPADLADPAAPGEVFKAALDHFGQVDAVVNNAGYFWDAPIHRMTDDQFAAMLEIHAVVPFRFLREAIGHWRPMAKAEFESGQARHRKIVNVSSRAALFGLPGAANYAAGKAALIGLTRSAARECARFNINVNAVAFGAVHTRFADPADQGAVIHTGGRKVPLGLGEGGLRGEAGGQRVRSMSGRMATPAEAAATIVYLCSPLSDLVNGEVVAVNG